MPLNRNNVSKARFYGFRAINEGGCGMLKEHDQPKTTMATPRCFPHSCNTTFCANHRSDAGAYHCMWSHKTRTEGLTARLWDHTRFLQLSPTEEESSRPQLVKTFVLTYLQDLQNPFFISAYACILSPLCGLHRSAL